MSEQNQNKRHITITSYIRLKSEWAPTVHDTTSVVKTCRCIFDYNSGVSWSWTFGAQIDDLTAGVGVI